MNFSLQTLGRGLYFKYKEKIEWVPVFELYLQSYYFVSVGIQNPFRHGYRWSEVKRELRFQLARFVYDGSTTRLLKLGPLVIRWGKYAQYGVNEIK